MTCSQAADDQIADGARGFDEVIDDGGGSIAREILFDGGTDGVQHDDRAAPIERVKDRIEARIGEVNAVGVGRQLDPVNLQSIEGVVDLRQRLLDRRQGQCREQPEPLRILLDERGAVFIDLARELDGLDRIAEGRMRRRQR